MLWVSSLATRPLVTLWRTVLAERWEKLRGGPKADRKSFQVNGRQEPEESLVAVLLREGLRDTAMRFW